MSSVIEIVPATPDQVEDYILWERGRIGAFVMLAGIAAFFVGELALRPLQRPGIHVVQLLNFAFLVGCLKLGDDPRRRAFNCFLCFAGFSVTAAAVGAIGIVARDPTSTLVVLNGLALGTAILVPWGPRYQIAAVAVAIACALWTYGATRPFSIELWLQPVGLVVPSLTVSVVVAYLLRRQRLMTADAERERAARELGLRESNRRLEVEVRERESTEKMLRFALLELDHRVKNTLATLQSMAEQTLETSDSAESFAASFRDRIRAMSNIHTGLAARRWEGLDVRELIALVVGPYRPHEQSVSVHSDAASLSAEDARSLGTALHELATNAARYGALTTADGRVDIDGTVAGDRLRLVWMEHGGPPVDEPERRGLGTKLIESALGYESGGTARLSFPREGVRCEIDMPLGRPTAAADAAPPPVR